MSPARALRLAILALLGAGGVLAAEPATAPAGPKASPFMPPAAATTAATQAADSGEGLEFAGISSVGNRTDYILYDRAAKKSHWLGMGETKNGIALISHDARREILTVSANGVHKQLTLRKAGASGNRGPAVAAMAPVQTVNTSIADSSATIAPPPPVQPMPPPPPSSALPDPRPAPGQEAIVKQETEARMLVSDLLEIGMAQRRAYEEAQRRSSPGNPSEGQPETPKQP